MSCMMPTFTAARLENSNLDNSAIHEADFSYANMKNASLVYARGRAGLPNENECWYKWFLPVSFRYTDLSGADLTGANLKGADFTEANLTGANFSSANLQDANFSDASLKKADFSGANLTGANLNGAITDGAVFDG